MAKFCSATISCGIKQLYGLAFDDPKGTLYSALNDPYSNGLSHCCMVLFSDTVKTGNHGGNALARYIEEKKLGKVTASEVRVNPNSRNKIQTWIWYPNKRAVSKWLKEQKQANV